MMRNDLDENDINLDNQVLQRVIIVNSSRPCPFQLAALRETLSGFGLQPDRICSMITSAIVPVVTLPAKTYTDEVRLKINQSKIFGTQFFIIETNFS